jgi:hypothetical protein
MDTLLANRTGQSAQYPSSRSIRYILTGCWNTFHH